MPAAMTGHEIHDPVLVKLIHGKSAGERNAFLHDTTGCLVVCRKALGRWEEDL